MWRSSVDSRQSGPRLTVEEKGFDWLGFRGGGGVAHGGGGQL